MGLVDTEVPGMTRDTPLGHFPELETGGALFSFWKGGVEVEVGTF